MLKVKLSVPGGDPLHITALVRGARKEGDRSRVSFQFLRLDRAAVERMEMFVFDAILLQLRNCPGLMAVIACVEPGAS